MLLVFYGLGLLDPYKYRYRYKRRDSSFNKTMWYRQWRLFSTLYTRVSEPAARGIHCCPNFFISFARPASLHYEEYVYVYTYLSACRLYMNYSCYQITPLWNIFTQIGSGAKCWLDIYQCRWLGQYVTSDSTFHSVLFKQETMVAAVISDFLPYLFALGELYQKYKNYTSH